MLSLTDMDVSDMDLNADINLETESDMETLSLNDLAAPTILLILSLIDIPVSVIVLNEPYSLDTESVIVYDFTSISNGGLEKYAVSNTDPKS